MTFDLIRKITLTGMYINMMQHCTVTRLACQHDAPASTNGTVKYTTARAKVLGHDSIQRSGEEMFEANISP